VNTDITVPSVIVGGDIGGRLADETANVEGARRVRSVTAYLHVWRGLHGNAPTPVFLSRNMTSRPILCATAPLGGIGRVHGNKIAATVRDLASTTAAIGIGAVIRLSGGCDARAPASPTPVVARFSRALDEWKGLLAPDHYDAMSRHVERLLSDQEELDEDGIVPSSSSFDDLLTFLAARSWIRSPALGFNRSGQFSASWSRGRPIRSDVTLTFLGDGTVKWYVYGLGRRRTGSAAGKGERLDLAEILSGLGCDAWMVDER
jgi:hypothetical protein